MWNFDNYDIFFTGYPQGKEESVPELFVCVFLSRFAIPEDEESTLYQTR